MKYLLIALMLITSPTFAHEAETISQDVNTPVPKSLEGATIVIRTKDGKEHTMKAEQFKVVPRKQQFKVVKEIEKAMPVILEKEVIVEKEVIREVPAKEKLNMVIGGFSFDKTSTSSEVDGNVVRLYSVKGPVGDIGYMRRRLFDTNFSAGLSINTNIAPRGFVGYEF